jgi:hypothetical protein
MSGDINDIAYYAARSLRPKPDNIDSRQSERNQGASDQVMNVEIVPKGINIRFVLI